MGNEIQFKGYEQDQGQRFPAHLAEALDPSDPVFFISDLVEGLDLGRFERRYAAMGEHCYPPRLLLKLWLFGAVAGVYSGREIAQRVHWDLRFRYLAGGLYPDFRTINRFRVRHREDFAEVFRQTVRTARASGLGKLGRVAIDGTKIRANTSRHEAMGHQRMQQAEEQLQDEIAQILAQMDACNEAEDDEHGDDDGSGGLPAELQDRERRVAKLRAVRPAAELDPLNRWGLDRTSRYRTCRKRNFSFRCPKDAALAKKLTEVCAVDIFAQNADGSLHIVEANLDECVLCDLCIQAAPGKVRVLKLYE